MERADFVAFYGSPVLNEYINRQAQTIPRRETREDAVQEVWADILALNPLDTAEAKRIAKAAIMRHYRRDRRTAERETTALDLDRFEAR